MQPLLVLEDLSVTVGERLVLRDINLVINPGETHVLFGPNGSGKTTLLGTIMGFSRYRVVKGRILFRGEDITSLPVDQRAAKGIGLAFQRPPSLRGVLLRDLVRRLKQDGVALERMAEELKLTEFLDREVNYGFSGGELKRSELLQLLAQNPSLVMLDEPESGVDVENMALIGKVVNYLLEKEPAPWDPRSLREVRRGRTKGGLIITHTGYILNYVEADVGHVLFQGKLCCSGNPRELFSCIQKVGYTECIRCMNLNGGCFCV
ncbi:ABC transporter related protein [Ammonifex degensii KC4]|uniref:ABC transporter related protein n=1 Tax=Ammonifex degensii (strain DSM 10501 / KC4) TaxID=429009 RepID=C9RBR8_AMMDK|nr:ABC transporter ATP-binding protein [Ammonifex degensii]ACX51695.1 ABC transporter related protein [Ammonifex degensii KC4]